jgi:hypothetical protein
MTTQDQIRNVVGSTAYDRAGDKVGKIGQVYFDDETDQPKWVTVHTGLFGTSESFVPLQGATHGEGGVTLAYEKSKIKDAPHIGDDARLSPAEEDELYRYYGLDSDAAPPAQGRHTQRETETGARGRDTSGPTTDDAMTRSEERLNVATEARESGRARLRKHVVTEHQQVSVPAVPAYSVSVRVPVVPVVPYSSPDVP